MILRLVSDEGKEERPKLKFPVPEVEVIFCIGLQREVETEMLPVNGAP
jgi:hypothetical protein